MEYKILEEINQRVLNGETCGLVTVTESKGSTPRKIGAIMGVFPDKILGTIGGGLVEFEVIKETRELFETGENKEFKYGMGQNDKLKLACGGEVKGFIKIFKPASKLVVIGAGHVSKEITYMAKSLNFDIVIIDDREDYIKLNDIEVLTGDVGKHINSLCLPKNTYVVIASRGHIIDKIALREVINQDIKYIGMMGSKMKVIQVCRELLEEGIDIDDFKNLYAPIGLDFSDGTPSEIAIEVLSEILKVKNGGSGSHRGLDIEKSLTNLK